MVTVVTRIEAIINTRPLTAISTTDNSAIPLRPVDFLQGNISFSLPNAQEDEAENDDSEYDPECLQTVAQAREALEFSQHVADKFWSIYNTEYLTMLRDVQKTQFKKRRCNARTTPKEGEIVLIEHDLLPRGHWAIGKIVELIHSADGLIRSAIVQFPHKNKRIQRPVTKLYPLELRTSTEPKNAGNPNHSSAENRDERPPRLAKTKAYDALRQLKRSNENKLTGSENLQLMVVRKCPQICHMLTIVLLMASICAQSAAKQVINCSQGVVTIYPRYTPFQVCINDHCKVFNNSPEVLQYVLEPSPHSSASKVTVTSHDLLAKRTCPTKPFCEHVANLLSKALIGNPYCWLIGAIVSVGLISYLMISLVLLIAWLICRKRQPRATVISNTTNIALSVMTPERRNGPFTLADFTPAALRPTQTMFVAVTLVLVTSTIACQEGYMRHSVELICSERNICHHELRREILFNSAQATLCIQLRHQNTSVGYLKVRRASEQLKCQKVSQFWTKETYTQVQQVTRCRGMGSCHEDKCESLLPTETVPELMSTALHPGYSGCSIQCSGINCVCAIPFRACTFYRVSHVPMSSQVYEVFDCVAWIPTITLSLEIKLYNVREHGQLILHPYSTGKFKNFKFTVISTEIPQAGLRQKFAQATNETLIIRDDFIFAVTCKTREQAQSNFSSCANTHYCDCDVNGIKPSCRCPHNTFDQLRRNSDHVLPVATPQFKIFSAAGTVSAKTNEGETTVAITTEAQIESAQLVVDVPCTIQVHNLRGCYSCRQASTVEVSCLASVDSWTTVTCAETTFPIECSPHNKTTEVKIKFEAAVVDTICHTTCGNQSVSVKLSGVLNYVTYTGETAAFVTNSTTVLPQLDWLENIHLPDLSPLRIVFIEHWKLALATTTAVLVLVLLTYLFGPIVILTLTKLAVSTTLLLIEAAWMALKASITFILRCLREIRVRNMAR